MSRVSITLGAAIRHERRRRGWTLRELALGAGLSAPTVHSIEVGRAGSIDAYGRLAAALALRLDFDLSDRRSRDVRPGRTTDHVHAAMGEVEARHLRALGFGVGVDEPYQHYQFAGRADVVAWDLEQRALLHIENRTRFPDFQEMAGSYNAKRAYLADSLGQRIGVRRWASETNVIAALWSAEVLHTLRLRRATFEALCPDPTDAWAGWWSGQPPTAGMASTLVVIDPHATGRQRVWIGLPDAIGARPRHRGYAEAAARLEAAAARLVGEWQPAGNIRR